MNDSILSIRFNSSIIILVRQGRPAPYGRREDMDEMTSAELNQYLENIAKLIEANVKDAKAAEEAAKIVRDSKVKA